MLEQVSSGVIGVIICMYTPRVTILTIKDDATLKSSVKMERIIAW